MLEYLQTMTADRHGTVQDACEKVAGGLLGAGGMHVAIRCLNAPPIKRQVIRGCRKAEPENSTSLIVESHLPCSSVGDRKLRLAPSERLPPKELKPAEEPGRASYGRVRPPLGRSRMRTGPPGHCDLKVTPIKRTERLEVVPAIADRRSSKAQTLGIARDGQRPTVKWPRKRAFGRIAAR